MFESILDSVSDFVGGLFGGDDISGIGPVADGDEFADLLGSAASSSSGSSSSGGSIFGSSGLAALTAGLSGLGGQLIAGDMREEQLELARERLELEKRRIDEAERTGGFNRDLAKRKLELEVALSAIAQAKDAAKNTTEQQAALRGAAQQGGADTGRTIDALDRMVARFQSGIK